MERRERSSPAQENYVTRLLDHPYLLRGLVAGTYIAAVRYIQMLDVEREPRRLGGCTVVAVLAMAFGRSSREAAADRVTRHQD